MASGDFNLIFKSNASEFAGQIDQAFGSIYRMTGQFREAMSQEVSLINAELRKLGSGESLGANLMKVGSREQLQLTQGIAGAVERGMQAGLRNALRSIKLSNIDVGVRLIDENGAAIGSGRGRGRSGGGSVVLAVEPEGTAQSPGRGRPASLGVSQEQIQSIREARQAVVQFTDYVRKTGAAAATATANLERLVASLNGLGRGVGSGEGLPFTAMAGVPTANLAISPEALAAAFVPVLQKVANASHATAGRATVSEPVPVTSFLKNVEGGLESTLDRFFNTRVSQLVERQQRVNPNVDRSLLVSGAEDRARGESELFRAMLEPAKFFSKEQYGLTQGTSLDELTKDMNRLVYEAGRRIINKQLPHDDAPLSADAETVLNRRLGFARLSSEQRETIRGQGEYDPFNAAGSTSEVVKELLKIAESAGVLREDMGGLEGMFQAVNAVVREHTEATTASVEAAQETTSAFTEAAAGVRDFTDIAQLAAAALRKEIEERQALNAQMAERRRFGGTAGERQEEFYGRSQALQTQLRSRATELIPENIRAQFPQIGLPANYVFPEVSQVGEFLKSLSSQGGDVGDLDSKMRQIQHIGSQIAGIQAATDTAIRAIAEPNPQLESLLDQARTGQERIFGKRDIEDNPDAIAKQVESDERALRTLQRAGVRVALPELVDRLLPNGRLPGTIDPSANQIQTQGSSIPATKGRSSGFVDQNLGATFFPEFYNRMQSALQAQEAGQNLNPAQLDDIRHWQEAQSAVGRIYNRIQQFKKEYTPIVNQLIRTPGFSLSSLPAGTPLRALSEGLMQNLATGTEFNDDKALSDFILQQSAHFDDPEEVKALRQGQQQFPARAQRRMQFLESMLRGEILPNVPGVRPSPETMQGYRDELEGLKSGKITSITDTLVRGMLAGAPDGGHSGDFSQMAPEEAAAVIQAAGLEAQRSAAREGAGFSRSAVRGSLGELLQGMGIRLTTSNFNRIPQAKELPGLDQGVPGTRDKIQEFNRALSGMVQTVERLVRVAPEEVPEAFQKQFENVGDLFTRLTGQPLESVNDGLRAGQQALARTRTAASRGGANITYTRASIVGGPKTREQIVQEELAKAEQARRDMEERQGDLVRRALNQSITTEGLSSSELLSPEAARLLEPGDTTSSVQSFSQSLQALRALTRQDSRFDQILGEGALSAPLTQLRDVGRLQSLVGGLSPEDIGLLNQKTVSRSEAEGLMRQGDSGRISPIQPGTVAHSLRDDDVKSGERLYQILNDDLKVIDDRLFYHLEDVRKALIKAGVSNGETALRNGGLQPIIDEIIQAAVEKIKLTLRRLAAELSGTGITAIGGAGDRVSRQAGRPFDLSVGLSGFDEHGRPQFRTGDFDAYFRATAAADPQKVRQALAEDIEARGLNTTSARGDVLGSLPTATRELGLGALGSEQAPAGLTEQLHAAKSAHIEALDQTTGALQQETQVTEQVVGAQERIVAAAEEQAAASKRAGSPGGKLDAQQAATLRAHLQGEFPEADALISQGDFAGAARALRTGGITIGRLPDVKRAYGLKPEEAGELYGQVRSLSLSNQGDLRTAGLGEEAKSLLQTAKELGQQFGLSSDEAVRGLSRIYDQFVRLQEFTSKGKAGNAVANGIFGDTLGLNSAQFNKYKQNLSLALAGAGGGGAGGGGGGPSLGGADSGDPGGLFARLFFGKNGNGSILERQLLSVGRTWTRFSSDMLVFAGFAKFQQIATEALQLEKEFTRMGAALEAVNGSASGLTTLRGSLAGIATSLGAPLSDVVKTASEFIGVFKSVKDIEFATKITEQLKLISLGALSTEEAFKGISSIISGYQANGTFQGDRTASATFQGSTNNVQNLAKVGDLVAQASSITGTNVADIIEGAGRLAPEAASLNVGPTQLIGLVADVAKRSGQGGEAAGEQLSRAFSTLQTSKVQRLLEKYGVASEDQFNQGNYGDVLSQLLNKFPNLNHAQQASLREAIGSGRQAAVVNALLGDAGGVSRDVNNIAENSPGALGRRTNAILQTFSQQISIFEQNIQALANLIVRSGVLDGLGLLLVAMNKVFSLFINVGNGINKIAEDLHLGWLRDLLLGFAGLKVAGLALGGVFGRLPGLVAKAATEAQLTSAIGPARAAEVRAGKALTGAEAVNLLTFNRGGGAIEGAGRLRNALLPAGIQGGFLSTRFNVGGFVKQLTEELGNTLVAAADVATAGLGKLARGLESALGVQVLDSVVTSLKDMKTAMAAMAEQGFVTSLISFFTRLKTALQGILTLQGVSSIMQGVGLGRFATSLGGQAGSAVAGAAAGSAIRSEAVSAFGLSRTDLASIGTGAALLSGRAASAGVNATRAAAAATASDAAALGPEAGAAAAGGVPGIALAGVAAAGFMFYQVHQTQLARQKKIDETVKAITTGDLTSQQQNEAASNLFKTMQHAEDNPSLVEQNVSNTIRLGKLIPVIGPGGNLSDAIGNELGAASDLNRGNFRGAFHHFLFGPERPKDTSAEIQQIIEQGNQAGDDGGLGGRYARNRVAQARGDLQNINDQLKPLEDQKNLERLVQGAGSSKSAQAKALQQLTQLKTELEDRRNSVQAIIDGYNGIVFTVASAQDTNSVVSTVKALSPATLKNKNYQAALQTIIDNSQIPAGIQKDLDVLRNPTATFDQRGHAEISIKSQEVESLKNKLKNMSQDDQNTAKQVITQDLQDIDTITKQLIDSKIQAAQTLAQVFGNELNYSAEASQLEAAKAGLLAKAKGQDANDPVARATDIANAQQIQTQLALTGGGVGAKLAADKLAAASAAGAAAQTRAQEKTLQDTINALTKSGGPGAKATIQDDRAQLAGLHVQDIQNSISLTQAQGASTVASLQLAGNSSGAQIATVNAAKAVYEQTLKTYGKNDAQTVSAYAAYVNAQVGARDFFNQQALSGNQILVAQLNLAGNKSGAQNAALAGLAQAYKQALASYGAGSSQANSALAAYIQGQQSARDALIASLKTNLDLTLSQIDLKGGNNTKSQEADARLKEAQQEMATFTSHGGKKGSEDGKALQAQINNARRAQIDARLQDTMDTLDFQREMYKITGAQEIQQLKEILKQKNLTVQERRDIMLKIKDLGNQYAGQWNIGTIKPPTPYEMRAFMANALPNTNTSHMVANNVTINGADFDKIKALIVAMLGPTATNRVSSGNRKV